MKHTTSTLLIIAIAALSVQCALARPEPGIFDDILSGIGKAGQDFIDSIRKVTEDGAHVANSFSNGIRTAAEGFIKESQRINQNIAEGLQSIAQQSALNLAATLRAFAENLADAIAEVRNSAKRRALQRVQISLKRIEQSSSELNTDIENLSKQAEKTIERQENKIEREWNDWSDEQLARVNEATGESATKQAQAKQILDEFTQRASGYLAHCREDIRKQLNEYEQNAEHTISGYQTATQNLINEVQQCLKTADNLRDGLECSRNIRKQSLPLSKLPADFAQLKARGDALANQGIEGSACTIRTRTLFAIEKSNIERELDDIIKAEESEPKDSDNGNDDNDNNNDENENGNGNGNGNDNDEDDAGTTPSL